MRPVSFAIVIILATGGCAGSNGAVRTQRIEGVVIEIRAGDRLGDIESFTVKDGKEQFVIHVDPHAKYDFPLGHLNAHRAGAEPVRVDVESRDGKLVAVSISDA